jgi:undecaprenyl-diphosphatase
MRRRLYLGLGTIAVLFGGFGFVAEDVVEGETTAFDAAVLMAFRVPGHPDTPIGPEWLVEGARDASAMGGYTVLTILVTAAFIYLMIVKQRANAILLAGAVFTGTILSNILKGVFARPRPDLTGIVKVFTPSFPSGHSLAAAVTFLTFAAILSAGTKSMGLRTFYVALAVFLTVLIGITRIYLGVHFPTDVLAGWCLGSAWALVWFIAASLVQERSAQPATEHN